MKKKQPKVATFSIIGFDPETREWGIAVQSKFLGVGAVVPWAKAETGAIATQSFANTAFGPDGLALLEEGATPEEVVEALIADDPDKHLRQFAVMDKKGRTAAYTGKDCYDWAGHQTGSFCTAQGNILVSEKTIASLVRAFETTDGPLAERLIKALEDGQQAGGDSRGKQSAALFVVKDKGGYGGYNDRVYDLRVDDHPEPIEELRRLYDLHQLYFSRPNQSKMLKLEGEIVDELASLLRDAGIKTPASGVYDEAMKDALKTYYMRENFEERWSEDALIDPNVLDYMRKQATQS
ncbi:DUF1028 domain-containing protein [Salisediminibacterium selenitireducens]|uniref:Putative peptidoglycan binding domain-containing protein n=1 Tax=Bacillus selenitireducens (strain ATCC 700615 / DSM 15326 / MLS10) TaxID=439292 RepID=D6XXL3_BACIE|nr:DUF1028 domain-containing protein [Salisediminibacterium selenitireducens]ADI00056.1 protein of unknown function DUF1028 [[Bacillus] selenitireducens MLS10]